MLQLTRDAAFLDDRTDVLRGLFITYNHPRETFCTVELQVVQGRNGAFNCRVLLLCHHLSLCTAAVSLAVEVTLQLFCITVTLFSSTQCLAILFW
jgi:hypothetical protein